MKKIIIIGHPDSDYQEVEKIFQMHGMAPALPSKREQMTPVEIGKVLHKIQSQDNRALISSPTKKSRKPKPPKKSKSTRLMQVSQGFSSVSQFNMWNSLSMDLMLANIDQDFWGWSDPKAIDLVDYWAEIDPSIHFVFIYDKPQNIFQHSSLEEALNLNAEIIQERFESWQKYNQKLLICFNKHKERSVLLSSKRIQETVLQSTSEIYKQIAVPDQIINHLVKEQQDIIEDAQVQNSNTNQECDLSTFIVNNIMEDNQQVLSLYEELQNQANFPHISHYLIGKKSAQALSAWKEMIQQKIELDNQVTKNQQIQSEKEDLTALLNQQVQDLQNFEKELKDSEQKGSTLENIKNELEKKNSALENANIELEKQSSALKIQNVDFEKKQATLETQNSELQNKKVELEKQAKQAKDQAKSTQEQLLILEDENKALMTQLNFTQEELERLFLANQKLKEQPPLWGAADRIRNQLTYRIGHKLQQYGKSPVGWIKLPFVLYSTYRQYAMDKKKKEWNKLPPIHLYQDAYEAEKIKKHLSYKLGEIFMKEAKNPLKWLLIPSKLIKEGKNFKVDNKG